MSKDRNDLSIRAAAEELGVHPHTIRRYIARGILRGYRLGPQTIRIRAEDLDAVRAPLGGAA